MNEDLIRILTKYNFPKRQKEPTISITEVENAIGFALPADYKFYLENYAPFVGFIVYEYIDLWDIDLLLEYNNGYQILEALPATIAFGSNGGGDFLGIEHVSEDNFRIVVSPLIGLEPQYHTEIGSCFTDFLLLMDKGKEWFK